MWTHTSRPAAQFFQTTECYRPRTERVVDCRLLKRPTSIRCRFTHTLGNEIPWTLHIGRAFTVTLARSRDHHGCSRLDCIGIYCNELCLFEVLFWNGRPRESRTQDCFSRNLEFGEMLQVFRMVNGKHPYNSHAQPCILVTHPIREPSQSRHRAVPMLEYPAKSHSSLIVSTAPCPDRIVI